MSKATSDGEAPCKADSEKANYRKTTTCHPLPDIVKGTLCICALALDKNKIRVRGHRELWACLTGNTMTQLYL